jgi:hypothetical protein
MEDARADGRVRGMKSVSFRNAVTQLQRSAVPEISCSALLHIPQVPRTETVAKRSVFASIQAVHSDFTQTSLRL